jgi:TolA-binding protein
LGTLFLFLISLWLFSCSSFRAYYNTFFLAQKAFQAAEDSRKRSTVKELSPTTKKLYEEAITKASRVLTFFPKSKYVDDALLMIGQAYYYQGEYSKGERKFQEIITGFPKSNLASEANFFLGLAYSKQGQLTEASSIWQAILDNPRQKKFQKEALYSLAELNFEQEEYDLAIPLYRLFLSKYKKDSKAGSVQMQIAESFRLKEEYENAWKAYAEVKNYTKDRELIYQAELKAGQTAYQLGKITEGMAIYKRLAENAGYYSHLAEIKLQLAQGLLASGQIDQALKLNQEVIEVFPKTTYSAQGYYQQGIIHQDYKEDLKTAKELFDKAKDEKAGSDYSKKALEKSADITKLEEYRKVLTEGESLKVVETQFQLAEFYLTHLNKPDSALAAYKGIVTNHPLSEYAPKALLAVAYICRNLSQDTAGCRQACEELLKNYPATDYAAEAAKFLNRSPLETDSTGAAQLFWQAEEQLFTYQNLDSASSLYQKIIDLYPGSLYAPKAMLGKAHILEHQHSIAEDTVLSDSTVFLAYRSILERFPESEAAGVAQLKLGLKEIPKPKPVQPPPLSSDTTHPAGDSLRSFSAEGDTTDTLVRGLPLAPEPTNKAEVLTKFIYPPELIGERISGWVFLKIEIDYFTGEAKKVELMERGGLHDEIDRRVLQAMQIARFDIQKLDPKNFSGIYGYRFKIQAPTSPNQ